MKNRLIGATFFSGIGTPELACPEIDWRLCSEIEEFPRKVLAHRFGAHDVRKSGLDGKFAMFGDVTAIRVRHLRRLGIPMPEVIVAGSPCFSAGHMVLTISGHKKIEDVAPGDMVATHMGRFRPVLRVGSKVSEVGKLKAVGLSDGIVCTPDHPFLIAQDLSRFTRIDGKSTWVHEIGDIGWQPASRASGAYWSSLINIESGVRRIPMPHGLSRAETMHLLGWYLGDGWVRSWVKGKKSMTLGLSVAKVTAFRKAFPKLKQVDIDGGTSRKISIGCTDLCRWIESNLGCGAANKTIPGWMLSDPDRNHLLAGYIATDGNRTKSGVVTMNSVSEHLARGAAALAQTLGFVATVTKIETPNQTVIEGRTVSQRDYFACRLYPSEISRKSFVEHGFLLRKVQSFTPTGVDTVFNIEVDEDNSFVVNGAIVHNCQAFSIAGLRNGLDDDRGNLTLEFLRTVHAFRSAGSLRNLLWENVPGILSHKQNPFGCFLGGIVGSDDPILPPEGDKWPDSGMVSGPLARAAWTILDAQHFGLAQRRRRVFVVADFGNGADPAAVLFEFKSGSGYSPQSRESREGITHATSQSLTASGRGVERAGESRGQDPVVAVSNSGDVSYCISVNGQRSNDAETETFIAERTAPPVTSNPYGDHESREGLLVTHALRGEGFDASEDGTGRGTPIVPILSFEQNSMAGRGTLGFDPDTQVSRPVKPQSDHQFIGTEVAFNPKMGGDPTMGLGVNLDGTAYTLDHSGNANAVAFSMKDYGADASENISPTLRAGNHDKSHANAGNPPAIAFNARQDPIHGSVSPPLDTDGSTIGVTDGVWAVRRLTPLECERLQGLPDGHTRIPIRKFDKPTITNLRPADMWEQINGEWWLMAADGSRYKAIGNGMAKNVLRWVLTRIVEMQP